MMSLQTSRRPVSWWALALALAGSACSPSLDWRETRPDSALKLLFPCKPDQHTRRVAVEGVALAMTLTSCTADGQTFALGFLDAPSPDHLGPLMQALQHGLQANVAGAAGLPPPSGAKAVDPPPPDTTPFSVKGATPHPLSRRVSVAGRRPEGEPVHAEAGFFCRGLRIYQVTLIGSHVDALALETFLTSLTLSS